MRLQGKIAIVTGAGSGIGLATARRFADEGATVVLNDVNGAELADVASSLSGSGHESVEGDVSFETTAERLAGVALERFGRIDVLVNNAGMPCVADVTEVTDAIFDRVIGVNVKGMVWCCKHVIPTMLKQQGGSIINLGSISSFTGQESDGKSMVLYNVTKAAAVQLAISLATRYGAQGIRANAVCPGVTRTGILKARDPKLTDEEDAALWASFAAGSTPLERPADPSEVAAAILFLASDESSFVTGAPLIVDGGFLAR
jgi:NAD(P)-dependent dehydrogenase (short-subunit alcohol dehydrogenase family)